MYFYDFFQFSLIEDIIGWLVIVIFYFLFFIKAAGPKNITHISFLLVLADSESLGSIQFLPKFCFMGFKSARFQPKYQIFRGVLFP